MSEDVTTADLAAFLGISARAVAGLGQRGITVKAGPGRWRLRESVAARYRACRSPLNATGAFKMQNRRGQLGSSQATFPPLVRRRRCPGAPSWVCVFSVIARTRPLKSGQRYDRGASGGGVFLGRPLPTASS